MVKKDTQMSQQEMNVEVVNTGATEVGAKIEYVIDEGYTHKVDSYIRLCEKNDKFLGNREKAVEHLLKFALETLTKREQNTLDRHNTDAFMKEKAELEKMYDLLLNSKSPMSLEDKYEREKRLMFKYSIGTTRTTL
jgi:hypothetical protein